MGSSKDKPKGWHSRRHQTGDAQADAKLKAPATRTERREDADARLLGRAERTPVEQIAQLDFRLGKGKGAKRERAKLKVAS